MLEARVERLEEMINAILEKVAPMKTKTLKARIKPRWITVEMQNRRKENVRLRKKASRTKNFEDELAARQARNECAREMKKAKLEYLRKKLENLDKNSPDSWAAVGEYLGWTKPVSPTMLVQDGKVLTKGQELAEAMLSQYVRKEEEVNHALGEATGYYLKAGRDMTKENTGVFKFAKITKKEVTNQIKKVENKESFGHDKISYGFIKKMSKWISGELTEKINLSLEVKKYPKKWKSKTSLQGRRLRQASPQVLQACGPALRIVPNYGGHTSKTAGQVPGRAQFGTPGSAWIPKRKGDQHSNVRGMGVCIEKDRERRACSAGFLGCVSWL